MHIGHSENIHIVTALINALSDTINSELSRQQQQSLALQNQQFTQQMEKNRQCFQLQMNHENAQVQRELSKKNHQLKLLEQQHNFELMCKSVEWQHFLNEWPLRVPPNVLRQEQILPNGTVALRIFFAKSSNELFTNFIYPEIEQGLLEFIDRYHNVFNSNNIVFYHNAYKDNYYGGSINTNIRYALQELPVLIIDSNVLLGEICVSATIWGFGNALEQHATVFKLPYKIEAMNGKPDIKSIKLLSDQLLAYLKFVVGYAYDTYNLIMYNHAPLLPKIAQYESECQIASSPIKYQEIRDAFREQYEEIYSAVLGIETSAQKAGYAEKPESFKKTILHELRLEYARSVREFVSPDEFREILDESIRSWCELRAISSTPDFLKSLSNDPEKIKKYFSEQDRDYFINLCDCYSSLQVCGQIGESCLALQQDVISAFTESKTDVREENTKRRFIEL